MFDQFQFTRRSLLRILEGLDDRLVTIQPKKFNNNILWHIGHILVVNEKMIFGFPINHSSKIPTSYYDLFCSGSDPSKWNSEVPELEVLITYLEEQSNRINELPNEFFEKKLPFEFPLGTTYKELYEFLIYHESEHIGQIKAMKKICK